MFQVPSSKFHEKGFTLIELLVVIAIIGVLSSIVLVSVNTVREKARDATRKSDLNQIGKAIEMFYNETGSYPREGCNNDTSNGCLPAVPSGGWTGNGLAADHLGHNISEFITLPLDPVNDTTHYYHYEPHCQVGNTKQGYWLRVLLEGGGWHYVKAGHQGGSPCPECGSSCW